MADAGARKSDADVGESSRKRRKKNPPQKKTDAGANANEIVELQMKLHRRHVDRTVAHLWDAADAAGAVARGLPDSTFTGDVTGIKLYLDGLLLSGRGETKWVAIRDNLPMWKAYLVSNGYEEWSDIALKSNRQRDIKQAAMNHLLRCMVLGSDESNAAKACIANLKNSNHKWYIEVYDYFKDKSFKNAPS